MNATPGERVSSKSEADLISVELSSRRTGMSFQRTRMGADRTLMAAIRTSMSLISFGFTLFQVFQKLYEAKVLQHAQAPRNFGLALVLLGITMLVLGILYHVQFMAELRRERTRMKADGLIHGESAFPVSMTLIVAVLLLVVGLMAWGRRFDDVRRPGSAGEIPADRAAAAAERRAQRTDRAARRRGLRRVEPLRRADRHADRRAARG
jgi:putative membrane protein